MKARVAVGIFLAFLPVFALAQINPFDEPDRLTASRDINDCLSKN
jgi:hypothetical protein